MKALGYVLPDGCEPMAEATPAVVELDEPCPLAVVNTGLEIVNIQYRDQVTGVVEALVAVFLLLLRYYVGEAFDEEEKSKDDQHQLQK